MLIKITEYQNLDTRKLMDVYSESNYENTDYFILTKQIKMQPSERLKRAFWIFLRMTFSIKQMQHTGFWRWMMFGSAH